MGDSHLATSSTTASCDWTRSSYYCGKPEDVSDCANSADESADGGACQCMYCKSSELTKLTILGGLSHVAEAQCSPAEPGGSLAASELRRNTSHHQMAHHYSCHTDHTAFPAKIPSLPFTSIPAVEMDLESSYTRETKGACWPGDPHLATSSTTAGCDWTHSSYHCSKPEDVSEIEGSDRLCANSANVSFDIGACQCMYCSSSEVTNPMDPYMSTPSIQQPNPIALLSERGLAQDIQQQTGTLPPSPPLQTIQETSLQQHQAQLLRHGAFAVMSIGLLQAFEKAPREPCFWFETKEPFLKDGQVVVRFHPKMQGLDIIVESTQLFLMHSAPTQMEIVSPSVFLPPCAAEARPSGVPWCWKFAMPITYEVRDTLTSCNVFHFQLHYPGGSALSYHRISFLKSAPRGKSYMRCRDKEKFPMMNYEPLPPPTYL